MIAAKIRKAKENSSATVSRGRLRNSSTAQAISVMHVSSENASLIATRS